MPHTTKNDDAGRYDRYKKCESKAPPLSTNGRAEIDIYEFLRIIALQR